MKKKDMKKKDARVRGLEREREREREREGERKGFLGGLGNEGFCGEIYMEKGVGRKTWERGI